MKGDAQGQLWSSDIHCWVFRCRRKKWKAPIWKSSIRPFNIQHPFQECCCHSPAQPGPWTKAKQREGMLFKLLHAPPDTHHLATILNKYLHSPFTAGELEVQSSNRICWGSGRYGIWIQVALTPPRQVTVSRGAAGPPHWMVGLGQRFLLRGSADQPRTRPQNTWEQTPFPWASSLKTSWW